MISTTFKVSRFSRPPHIWPRLRTYSWQQLSGWLTDFKVRPDIQQRTLREQEQVDELIAAHRHDETPDDARFQRLQRRLQALAQRGLSPEEALNTARDELHKRAAGQAKLQLPAWSPAIFKPQRARGKKNVVAVSLLVLDYDEGITIPEAHELWSRWPHLIHTSWSHTPETHKFRVVLPLASPMPAELWERTWLWAHRHDGGRSDEKCKDASRMYFCPALRHPYSPHYRQIYAPMRLSPLPKPPRPRPASRLWRRRRHQNRVCLSNPEREQRRRLNQVPAIRLEAGLRLQGRLVGEGADQRIVQVPCPSCNRRSVWFFTNPLRKTAASCNHRDSCGLDCSLFDLLVTR